MQRNFKRFMRMVEQKKEAVASVIREQERLLKAQHRLRPAGDDRSLVEGITCLELLKKKKPS